MCLKAWTLTRVVVVVDAVCVYVHRSPHNADRTKEFQFESVTFFVEHNLKRYLAGQDLLNVCDKTAGY